jgi:hypothetical protein
MAIDKSNVYKPIERSQNLTEKVIFTRGLWSDGTGELLTFYTSSTQNTSSKQYYYQVWLSSSATCNDQSVFSVAYGHISGSGSLNSGGESSDTPTRAIYSQYRLLCLDPNETTFKHKDSTTTPTEIQHFYAINFDRVKLGDKLDPGNFELSLARLNGGAYANSVYTGSNVAVSSSNIVITLIDDSSDATDTLGYGGIPSNVRALVSGTIEGGIYNPSSPHYYGLVYPDLGTIIIDAASLNASASFNTVTGSNIAGDNSMKLFKSISGSGVLNSGFTARAVDIKEQDYYFVRIYNQDFNYSNNPTYTSTSTDLAQSGKLSNTKFQYEPVTYITSVGLFNDRNELLAIAKMSKPIQKSFSGELSITVKLEY